MSIYNTRLAKDFYRNNYAIVDNTLNSPDYFNVVYFPEEVGGGKSVVKLTGGPELVQGYEIDAEILDANGDPLDYEFSTITDRYGYKYLSFSVYDNTALGTATVYLVGATNNAPIINGEYNVIWSRDLQITPYRRNDSELVFDKPAGIELAQVSINTKSLLNSALTNITSSNLTLLQANFKGFDKILAEDSGIVDTDFRTLAAKTIASAVTVNSINTTYRDEDSRISNGYAVKEWSRYNTIISSSTPIFNSGFLGATVEFVTTVTENNATASFAAEPYLPNNFSGSVYNALDSYKANIVNVLDTNMVVVDKSLDVVGSTDGIPATFTFTKATNFTASFNYAPNVQAYVTSSNIKQSFLQFTFTDLQPISGQVNSVRVYYKLANAVSDYKLLTQEFVRPIEYLTDARYINQSGYGQEISKYLLIGHFTTQSIVNDYWTFGYQDGEDIDVYRTPSQQYGTPLIDSIRLYPSKSRSEFCHTTYYQNYAKGQQYTTTFYVVLDPEVDLEVYLTSTNYKPTLFGDNTFPLAFRNSTNFDKSTGNKGVNPYGKFVGKITNTNSLRTFYDKVGFDFEPDDDGLGKLLLRAVPRNSNSVGYAFISKISVTPKMLTGFTPSLFQFTTPATNEFFTQISQSLDFKISYHDYTGKQSEYETYVLNVPYGLQVDTLGSTCQAEQSRTWDFKFPYYAIVRSGSGVTSTNYFTSSLTPFTNETVYGGFQEISSSYNLLLETSSRDVNSYPLYYYPTITQTYTLSGSFNVSSFETSYSNCFIHYYPPGSFIYTTLFNEYVAPGAFATFSISQSLASGSMLVFNSFGGSTGATLDLKINSGTSGSYTQRVWPLTVSGSTNQRWQYGKALGDNPKGTITATSKNPTTYDSYWNTQIPTVLGIDNFSTTPQTITWTSKYTESIQNDAAQGMVTSSWKWLDQFYLNFSYTGSTLNNLATTYLNYGYGPYVSSSIDNRKFNAAGFIGITKTDVSNSYASESREFGNSADNLRTRSEALKKRKLLWPVNGPASSSYFVENGGIYNVQFKLARTGSYSPDSGSYLMVYIFNANADLVNEKPFPGSKGFRPPEQNIVKIGNGYTSGSVTTPLIVWYNEEDDTYYEQYDINLIQWGTPAQLVFEPGYTTILTAPYSASFGCLITDVSFCKIGVTTDATYLKPQNFQEFVTPYYTNIKTVTGENTLIPIRR